MRRLAVLEYVTEQVQTCPACPASGERDTKEESSGSQVATTPAGTDGLVKPGSQQGRTWPGGLEVNSGRGSILGLVLSHSK